MHRILFLPEIRPAGYPANPKAGYRISGVTIWYPSGYRISKKAGLSGRISGASLSFTHALCSSLGNNSKEKQK
jgi:hypothetical protein